MKAKSVAATVQFNLCSSCGMCKNICPKHCISWTRQKGMFYPTIDQDLCVSCGLCSKICPGLGHKYGEVPEEPQNAVQGKVLQVCNAWTKNEGLRHVSASGGVVSTIITTLLKQNIYHVAFVVDSYNYDQQLVTKPIYVADIEEFCTTSYPKSRYLPVSHEIAVQYVREHPQDKVIFIGTACAVRGFLNVIEQLNLKRENYLLLGLFCDKVFNYNVYQYFSQPEFCGEHILKELHFKNKDSGGWPGNMKFIFSDGNSVFHDKAERGKVKDYFVPERCIYCIDKLNVKADISLGDNYTGQDASEKGSNSVIIRTDRGLSAWNLCLQFLETRPVIVKKILEAQYIEWRLNNQYYAYLKQLEIQNATGNDICLNENVIIQQEVKDYRERWQQNLKMLYAGEVYADDPTELKKQLKAAERKQNQGAFSAFASRVYHAVKRRLL